MKVSKPTYSKPLPEGVKILRRKDGKYAKYRDNKGVLQEGRLTKSGDKILCEIKLWHIRFEDNIGIHRSVKGYTDKAATQRLADNIQKLLNCNASSQQPGKDLCEFIENLPEKVRAELKGFNLLGGFMLTDKTLAEYIEEFKEHLTRKERNLIHIREITGTLRRIFLKCGFVTWTDISPERLMNFLDGLRDEGRGISKRRYNGLLGTVKQFCRWMVKQRKATSSPIEYLDGLDNPQTDQRHRRRVLELDDFRRFLEATLTGKKKYSQTGYERNFIYRLAAETALRSIDFHRLRVQDCDFEERKIRIEAGRIKNKENAFVYLKPATAVELQQYCSNKMPHTKVFHLPDKSKMAKMIRFDLAAAKIPYAVNGEYFDFHSLRHQSASLYGMNPETPEAVRQQLTRHKTPDMARHYTHASEQQQREAVEDFPDLTQPSKEAQTNVKTGTDNDFLSKSCFGTGHPVDSVDTSGKETAVKVQKTLSRPDNEGTGHKAIPLADPQHNRPLGNTACG